MAVVGYAGATRGSVAQVFRDRRDAVRRACPDGIVVLRGATGPPAGPTPFRQDSTFWHLTGVETPGACLVLLPDGVPSESALRHFAAGAKDILFVPERDPAIELWTGPWEGPGPETSRLLGFDVAASAGQFWTALTNWLRQNQRVYTVTPFGEDALLTPEYALMEGVRRRAPAVRFRDIGMMLARMRAVKSPDEVQQIVSAIETTLLGQVAARSVVATGAGRFEYEVEAAVLEAFRGRGAGLAFPVIAGAGINGTVLHYENNSAVMQAGDLVVVDIGARAGEYCGDVTRTYPVGGRFSERQRAVYDVVLGAQRHAVREFRPGKDTLRDMRARCLEFLKSSELRSRDATGTELTLDNFMPHGLSHHLGIDVHDAGDNEAVLASCCVITIEPGVYLPSEKIGVRLEDDYLVTDRGLELLGSGLPSEADAVEQAMHSR